MRIKCTHSFLLVDEFNPLGAAVSCLRCGSFFQRDLDLLQSEYIEFIHIEGKEGKPHDTVLLIRPEVLDVWPKF